MIEIVRPDGDNVLLAFTRETVPVIEIAGGRMVVAVPEDDEETIMWNDRCPHRRAGHSGSVVWPARVARN